MPLQLLSLPLHRKGVPEVQAHLGPDCVNPVCIKVDRFPQHMKESAKIERTHLPRDSMEVWLESQTPKRGEAGGTGTHPKAPTKLGWRSESKGDADGHQQVGTDGECP